ncbi:MAG TPA: dynamin family protein [Bacteroidia bacterium]|nr:dynamin family protein [Bacteroidia bacterium]
MQAETKQLPGLDAVANLMARVGLLETLIDGREKDESYFAGIQPVALGIFRMVVMGEIKKGKSSFINALCGVKGLVPVHDNVATSTIFKIHHGDRLGYSVFFQPETGRPKLEIAPEELSAYGTEDGNPDNEKKVDFIAVKAPSQVLQDGLVLIDTPGVGGLFKKHRGITFQYAPNADAIFFVTDSVESPIGAEEVDFLKELHRITPHVYFVQTKGAEADPESRRRRMENNIDILVEKVGIPRAGIRYFIVDSNMKMEADAEKNLEDLEDSGFQPLTAYLHQVLKPARDRNIATVGLRRASTKLAEIRSVAERQKAVLDADTADKQAALTEELKEAEARMGAWNSDIRPQLAKEFQIQAQEIQDEISATLQRTLPPSGELSEAVGNILADTQGAKPEAIYEMTMPLASKVRAEASELMLQISQDLESRFTDLLRALAVKAGASMAVASLKSDDSKQEVTVIRYADTQLAELVEQGRSRGFLEEMKPGFYGGMMGGQIGGIVGGIVGFAIPVIGVPIGIAVGHALGSIWTGAINVEVTKEKEASVARQKVRAAIDKDLASIYSQVQPGFHKAFRDLRSKAEDALGEMVKASMAELAATRASLQGRMRATSQEIVESRQKVQALQGQVEGLQGELDAMGAMLRQ